jgi:hypothetical protein
MPRRSRLPDENQIFTPEEIARMAADLAEMNRRDQEADDARVATGRRSRRVNTNWINDDENIRNPIIIKEDDCGDPN